MPPPPTHRLLVIDDDPSIHDLVKAMLAEAHWEMDSVASGEEALERLKQEPYDVLLSDILMPGMDGLVLLSELRDRHPNTPVVMMTLYNTPDHVLESLRRQAAAYISKPFSREGLLATLHNARSTRLPPAISRFFQTSRTGSRYKSAARSPQQNA